MRLQFRQCVRTGIQKIHQYVAQAIPRRSPGQAGRVLSLTCLALLLLSGCGQQALPIESGESEAPAWQQAEIYLALARQSNGESELTATLLEASNGRIYCNAYGSNMMGSDQQMMEALANGNISLVQCSPSTQVAQVPQLALLDTPYLFDDPADCNAYLSGPLLDFFQPYYNQAGLQLLSWYCSSFRQMTSNVMVDEAADMSRVKIRVIDNKYNQIFWSGMGAQTIPLAYGELFYALQQGVVNSQENPVWGAISADINQVQDYIIVTNHLPFIRAVVMNKEAWDRLSAADQEILLTCVNQVYGGDPAGSVMDAATLASHFKRVLYPSEDFLTELRAGAEPVKEALRQDLGAEISDSFYALME